METQTKGKEQSASLSVFGVKPKDAIIVPEIPLVIRNNCQSGQWTIGDQSYGSKIAITIIDFKKFYGTLGMNTASQLWGQIWAVAEAGDVPLGVAFVTYIKGRSLSDFNRKVTEVMATGVEPANGIFIPSFVKHSGSKPDESGVVKPINYFSLQWEWYERGAKFPSTNDPILKQLDANADKAMQRFATLAAIVNDPATRSNLVDLESTRNMVPATAETAAMIAAMSANDQATIAGNQQNYAALPAGL